MLFILVGKSGSGKSTLFKELPGRKIPTVTTRPRRDNEEANEYIFTSIEEFEENLKNGLFLAYKRYETTHGEYFYGTRTLYFSKGLLNRHVYSIILDPVGALQIANQCLKRGIPYQIVYLTAPEHIRRERIANRGDDYAEYNRRAIIEKMDSTFYTFELGHAYYDYADIRIDTTNQLHVNAFINYVASLIEIQNNAEDELYKTLYNPVEGEKR